MYEGFDGIRLVGQTADKGADILAHKFGKRWLLQVKHWRARVGVEVIDRTLDALHTYRATVPVIVSLNGFESAVYAHQQALLGRGIALQLWDRRTLVEKTTSLSPDLTLTLTEPRPYQESAIQLLVHAFKANAIRHALVVMATGLGKTFTAADAIRRIAQHSSVRVLVVAHTNALVYQLERSFWSFLRASQQTLVWNGYERPNSEDLSRAEFVFACIDSLAAHIEQGLELPDFDILLIDECHHVGGEMYNRLLQETQAGTQTGPFLVGLTATPWRPDDVDLTEYFGAPIVTIDMVTGLRNGFLSNVDYRMYTDNIDWNAIRRLKGTRLSPRQINRTLFISEWDDAVVLELQRAWSEQESPRAIVFCGTIDHAITMRDRINALGFCNAQAIYSQSLYGAAMPAFERNRILSDFQDGVVNVVCAVDIFNEGVDVPDVNIIVFQRVTHSRRIFIQQLGRGLRISPGKKKVIVLDFVSDIRRFAAGLNLKNSLEENELGAPGRPMRMRLPNKVSFRRVGGEDPAGETFLRQWLDDVVAVEAAGEDASVLAFPPVLTGGRQ